MIVFENNYANNHSNVNKRFAGMADTEFNWGFQWHINQPTAELCDIILPAPCGSSRVSTSICTATSAS